MTVPPLLDRARRQGRVAHAYLFYGRDPSRYRSAVRGFFKSLVCRSGQAEEFCGECGMCRGVERFSHPDLVVFDGTDREPGGGDTDTVGVETVREEIVEPASLTPSQAGYKLFWLNDINRFTTEATNTLLKVLEEPPGEAVFVLTSRSRREVPPTVRSRCHWVRWPAEIEEDESLPASTRRIWSDEEIDQERLDQWLNLLRGERRSVEFHWTRDRARRFLGWVLLLIHRKYVRPEDLALDDSDPLYGRLSYRLIPPILERFEELDRYGNPVTVVNSLLEELYYPGETTEWQNVI